MIAIIASVPSSAGFHRPGQSWLMTARKPASGERMKRKARPSAGAAIA